MRSGFLTFLSFLAASSVVVVHAGLPSKIYGVNLGSWSGKKKIIDEYMLTSLLYRLVLESWMLPQGIFFLEVQELDIDLEQNG